MNICSIMLMMIQIKHLILCLSSVGDSDWHFCKTIPILLFLCFWQVPGETQGDGYFTGKKTIETVKAVSCQGAASSCQEDADFLVKALPYASRIARCGTKVPIIAFV